MSSDKHNLTIARATSLIFFHYSTWSQPKRCLLPYYCARNATFMELSVPSFVFHSSLLTTDFVVGTWWFPFITEIVCNSHSDYFDCRGSFQTVVDLYCCITGWTQLAMATSLFTYVGEGVGGAMPYMQCAWVY